MLEPLRLMLLVHQGHADQTDVSITLGAVLRRTHAATVVCSAVTSTLFRPNILGFVAWGTANAVSSFGYRNSMFW